jgi:hypothetical protein
MSLFYLGFEIDLKFELCHLTFSGKEGVRI